MIARRSGRLRQHVVDGPGLLRMILTGTSGSGKSRAIRALVGQVRRLVRDAGGNEEEVVRSCALSAPTGTAAFQMRRGAATAHRTYGVPIGYCGPASDRVLKRLRARLADSHLHVIDEYGMEARLSDGGNFWQFPSGV